MTSAGRWSTRRNVELGFVIGAAVLVGCAEAIVEITRDNKVSSHVLTYAAVTLAVGLIAHLAIRRFARHADPLFLPCAVFLVGLGLMMIHRLDLGLAQKAAEDGTHYDGVAAASQVVWAFIGLGVFLAVLIGIRDHRSISR
ncbi:MAG TPA: FtsW/RodA/SpoVE family cell cycle protein, partial [Jatrophihabitans sp.]|nr:FtsW/RodA/SpoVE family cell cycle protein [Jatrophihabitans sp.]